MNCTKMIALLCCFVCCDFFDTLNAINELDAKIKKTKNCIEKHDCTDLELCGIEYVFASPKTLVFYIKKYNLVIKRARIGKYVGQEDEIALNMNHKNIVTTYVAFKQRYKEKKYMWLVMEDICGIITDKWYRQKKDIQNICFSVCDALLYMHANNYVHLDVKFGNVGAKMIPSNNKEMEKGLKHICKLIYRYRSRLTNYGYFYDFGVNSMYVKLIHDNSTPCESRNIQVVISSSTEEDDDKAYKLLDFGISRRYTPGMINTLNYNKHGTFPEIAYEIYIHKRYEKKTDVFGFGVLLYRLLYDTKLNTEGQDRTVLDYEEETVQKNRQKLIQSDKAIDKLILGCIENDVQKRYNMHEVKERLIEIYGRTSNERLV